jgi:hypothetical protein
MTEEVFRKRLGYVWLSFVIAAVLVSRFLTFSGLHAVMQKEIYLSFYLIALVVAIVFYRLAERDRSVFFPKPRYLQLRAPSKVGRFCARVFLLVLQAGLVNGIWDSRHEPIGLGLLGIVVGCSVNFVLTQVSFLTLRNEHLRSMQRLGA